MSALYEPDLTMPTPDVERTIIMAQADKHPLTAMLGQPKKSVSLRFSWPALLRSNPTVSANKDGDVQDEFNTVQPTELFGYVQEIREGWGIGMQAEAVQTYSGHNSPAFQQKKALERMYTKIERLLGSRQEQRKSVGTGTAAPTTASLARGLLTALLPSTVAGQTVDPFDDAFRVRPDAYFGGAIGAFTGDKLAAILAAIASYQGEKAHLMMLCGATLDSTMAAWVQKDLQASGPFNVTTRKFGESFDVNLAVNVFKFQHGTVKTISSYDLAFDLTTGLSTALTANAGVLLNTTYIKLRNAMPLKHLSPDQETGAGKRGFYTQAIGLEVQAPYTCGLVLPGVAADGSGSGDGDAGGSGSGG